MLVVLLIWVQGELGPTEHFTRPEDCAAAARAAESGKFNVKAECVARGSVA